MKKNNILTVILLALLSVSCASAYDGVQYEVHWKTRDKTASDTVAVLTTLTEPRYGEPFDLEIAYVLEADSVQDPRLYLTDRGCEFYMDREDHTWPGLYRKGDTLSCTFNLTPLMIGTVKIGYRMDFAYPNRTKIYFTLTLDETGRAVENPREDEGFGGLGLLPEAMPDTLYFVEHPCLSDIDSVLGGFGVLTKLSPPFRKETVSTIDLHATAACPFPDGVYYFVSYPDFLAVSIPDSSDWERYVAAEEELVLTLEAEPLGPGVGAIDITIRGMRPEVIPAVKGEQRIAPVYDIPIRIAVAIDENLELIACTDRAFATPTGSAKSSKSSERLSAISAAASSRPPLELRRIYSPHWKAHEDELVKRMYEKQGN